MLAVVVAALAGPAGAQDPAPAAIDRIFAAFARPGSPGCALAVAREGRVVYARGYGLANLEHAVPISSGTVFDIASTSKQLTAMSVALLARKGKLSLDDDVRKWVPELPAYSRPITLRHLLHHTSGLRDYVELFDLAGVRTEDLTTEQDALSLLARQKETNFAPGDEHLYSNSGYFLLSIVARRASGKTLRDLAEDEIFAPLGMTSTAVHDDHARVVPNRATGYAPAPSGGFRIDASNWEQTGDGSVFSSALDLLRWARNFEEQRVGDAELVRLLETPGTLNDGKKLEYAMGLGVSEWRGVPIVTHAGAWAGYRAELARFPAQHLAVACLCNVASANPVALAREVAALYLGEVLADPRKAGRIPARTPGPDAARVDLSRYAGLYRDAKTGVLRRVYVRDTALRMGGAGSLRNFELQPLGGDEFRLVRPNGVDDGLEVRFEPIAKDRYRLRVARGAIAEVLEPVPPASPRADELARYTGAYYSDELDVTYRVVLDGNRLFVRGKNVSEEPLEPTFADAFAVPGLQLVFRRANGGVVSFAVSTARVRNIRFVKLVPSRSSTKAPD